MVFASTGNWWIDFWDKTGTFFLTPDDSGLNYLARLLISLGIIIVAYFLIKFICFLLRRIMYGKKKFIHGPAVDSSVKYFAVTAIRVILWILVAILVVAILKIDTSGLAGIFSAVTVALGLALQDVIGCFASGVIVLHQKHILTGDFISVTNTYGTSEGTITRMHFLFTYLKTPAGQEVTIPNSNILKATVTNYTRLGKRRLFYDVTIDNNSDIELAKKVLGDTVKDDPRMLKEEGYLVYVYELNNMGAGMRIRLWTSFDDYWDVYNELSEKVLLALRGANIRIPTAVDRRVTNVD